MGTIKADTVTGLADPNKLTVPTTVTVGATILTDGSAGSTTITAEGGSTTTNLQQGLVKCFINQSSGQTIRDSFNVGSLTDTGTGIYQTNFTNSFNNNDYVVSSINCTIGTALTLPFVNAESDYATTDCEIRTLFTSNTDGGGTARDSDLVNQSFCGDLA